MDFLQASITRIIGRLVMALLTSCMAGSLAYGEGLGYKWHSVPLTTPDQAKAGVAGGEGFQQVLSIVYAPSDTKIVYMGSDTTKVWKSLDSGHSWRTASQGIDSNGARSLLVHPEDANIVLAAGCLGPEAERAHLLSQKRREGIFRTVDGGKSWNFIHDTEFHKQRSSGSLFATDLRTLGQKELTLFAGSYNEGLLVSNDTGRTWLKTGFDEGIIVDIEASPAEPGTMLVATSTGLFRYRDGLKEKIGQGLADAPSNIAVSPAAPDRVIAAVGGQGLYLSNDRGKSFHESSGGLPPATFSKVVDVFASPGDALRLYAGTWKSMIKGPFYSEDGGNIWKMAKNLGFDGTTIREGFWFPSPIAPHPRDSLVALTSSNGHDRILRTEDGGKTLSYSSSGYTGGRVIDMAFVSPQEWYLALTDYGLWRTTDAGKTFECIEIPGIHPRSIGSVAISGETIVLSIGAWQEKRLAISRDKGKSWKTLDTVTGRLRFVRFHPQKPNVVYAAGYRSDDNGQSWGPLKYSVMSIFPGNGDVVYGFDETNSTVVESTDKGSSWHALAGCSGVNIGVNEIAADPLVQGLLYLGANSGIQRVDGGQCTPVGIESGFVRDTNDSLGVISVAVNPQDRRVVYAGRWAPGKGSSSGVFRSEDFGLTWAPFNDGVSGSFDVYSVDIEPKETTVYIGTTFGLHVLKAPPVLESMSIIR